MIHSLAGGDIREKEVYTFALVEITSGESVGNKFWYKSTFFNLNAGDKVEVPLGINNKREMGLVIRVVTNVTNDRAPVPIKRTKDIIKKL